MSIELFVSKIVRGVLGWGMYCVLLTMAAAPASSQTLTPFSSDAGKFSISVPGTPKHQETPVGGADKQEKTIQHQYLVAGENGIFLISYQDNPNLLGATKEQLDEALSLGITTLLKTFGGEQLSLQDVTLSEKYPGRELRASIPAAKGEAKCRMYFVGIRLYQVMAVGVPDFVASEQTTKVLDSFAVLPQ
jgi:hypothetical protein